MSKSDDDFKIIFLKFSRLIKAYNKSTQSLLNYATERDLKNCDLESRNRDRLIKIIKKEYLKVKKKIALEKNANAPLFLDWEETFLLFVKDSTVKDVEILNILKGVRRDIQKAIASIYTVRKKIQSYSPNSVLK